MDKYKRYTGVMLFIGAVAVMVFVAVSIITPQYNEWTELRNKVESVTKTLGEKRQAKATIVAKLKKLQQSVMSSQKKIYSPVENKLGDDTLFFTLYSDLIEMVRANTIKIKSIDYKYNPKDDVFEKQKGSLYFVCDVNMEIISNYVNLGKLIQDIYQYPYYIKINTIEVIPYPKDKKVLLSKISMRLYAHTSPDNLLTSDIEEEDTDTSSSTSKDKINGANVPLPQ